MTTLTKEEIPDNRWPFLCSFRISNKDEKLDLTSLNCIHKLHKWPCKQLYCWVCQMPHKHISKLLTSILSAVKNSLQSYTVSLWRYTYTLQLATQGVVWIRCGFWKILKIQSRFRLSSCNSIKHTWLLYLLHNYSSLKTKDRFKELVQL